MIWLLVGYMWLFIHRPFEVWPALNGLYIERIYMIVTILCWALLAPKIWTSNRMNWATGLLAAAIVLATCFSPYIFLDDLTVQNWFKLLVFYVLVISSVRNVKELRTLIIAFVAITGIYEMHSFREYLCGRAEWRMGTWRMVGVDRSLSDPNSFAASVNYAIPMLLPLLTLAQKRWHYVALGGLVALACVCVFLTGSRTGFAGLALLFVGAGLMTRYRARTILLLVVAIPLVWLSLSENLQNRYLTLIDPSRGPANAQVSGDSRLQFFWMAVDIWKANPVFGVGPGCFSRASGTGMQAHTLYGQTVSELGTVGAIALLALVVCYLANYREGRRLYRCVVPTDDARFCYYVLLATAIAIAQLLFFGLGGHNLFRFTWLWYGAFAALALKFLREQSRVQDQVDYETPISAEL